MKNVSCKSAAILLAGLLTTGVAVGEDKSGAGAEEIMKKVEEAGKPGAEHKALEPLLGEWTAEVKCWMAPDAPPTASKGTAKAKWVMNGRFIQEEFSGEFMGKPFRGMSLTGYDNTKKKYVSVWLDDMSTALTTAEGEADSTGKTITLQGKYDCPMTGEKDVPMKQVVRIVSPEKHIFEMHDPRKGEKSKSMEITYTSTRKGTAVTQAQ